MVVPTCRMPLRIDPRIRDLIPKPSADELRRLEAAILADDGIRDAIVTWQPPTGPPCILDGHNRYDLAQKHLLDFETETLSFRTLEEAQRWVIENQLARRNLSEYGKGLLGLKLLEIERAAARARMSAGGRRSPVDEGVENLPTLDRGRARDKAGAAVGVSGRQLAKVDFLEQYADEETKKRLRAGETTVHKEHTRIKTEQRKAEAIAAVESKPQPLPDGPFDVIVADPPWSFFLRTEDAVHRGRVPYPAMSVEQICDLEVGKLAAPDAILWLWTTNSHLLDKSAAKVLEAWGFTGKTMLTWFKTQIGAGHWLRGQTEHCIFATRGHPVHTLAGESTALEGDFGLALKTGRREHSRKPEEFFAIVESVCPGSKVELFAREAREGWSAWGAEKEKFDD